MQKRKRSRAKAYDSDHLMFRSVMGILFIALGVLSVISVVGGVQGTAFTMVKETLQGLGGSLCLGIPIFLVWGGLLIAFSAYRRASVRAILFLSVFYLGVLGIINLLSKVGTSSFVAYAAASNQSQSPAVDNPAGYWEIIKAGFRLCRTSSALGGALGMLTAWPLWTYVGDTIGAVILGAVCLICVLFFSKFDIVGVIKQRRETADQRMEDREVEKQKQKALKQLRVQQEREAKQRGGNDEGAEGSDGQIFAGQTGTPTGGVNVIPDPLLSPYPGMAFQAQGNMPPVGFPAFAIQTGALQPALQTGTVQPIMQAGAISSVLQPSAPTLYDEMIVPEVPDGGKPSNWKPKKLPGKREPDLQSQRGDAVPGAVPAQKQANVKTQPSPRETAEQASGRTATVNNTTPRDRETSKILERMEQNRRRKEEIDQRIRESQMGETGAQGGLTPGEKAMMDTRFSEVLQKKSGKRGDAAGNSDAPQDGNALQRTSAGAGSNRAPGAQTAVSADQGNGGTVFSAAQGMKNPNAVSQEQWAFAHQVAAYRPPEHPSTPALNASGDRFAAYRKPANAAGEPAMSGERLDRADLKLPKRPAALETPPPVREPRPYPYPMIELLNLQTQAIPDTRAQDRISALKLEETLDSFSIPARVQRVTHGPAVTRFELGLVSSGVNVKRIMNIADNIALDMAANGGVRIEVPIPGTNLFGVEVPNKEIISVSLAEVLTSPEMTSAKSPLSVALGKDIAGKPIICDLAKMPHLLIAGQTGSGKSVCINAIIHSLLYRATPEEVRMIMIDPKVVELQAYNKVPHLLIPVVSDPQKAAGALTWAVHEMLDRYHKMQAKGVREISAYNAKVTSDEPKLPRIVIIIDELSDLMLACKKDVEESIIRLAQLARAAGIHMVVATQRPTVNVITGLIKANIPSRISFAVASSIDSRTILDMNGAEKLLGKGDMFYFPTGEKAPIRVQGCFVSDAEINAVVDYIGKNSETDYDEHISEIMDAPAAEDADAAGASDGEAEVDERLEEAIEMALTDGQASISMLQRRMKIGYARAGRLIDDMAARGIVSKSAGSKPREVLITFDQYLMGKEAQRR